MEHGLWLHSNGIYATLALRVNDKLVGLNDKYYLNKGV